MTNRRLKKNSNLRKSCDYLLKEVGYIQNSIDFLKLHGGSLASILRLTEQKDNLLMICDELRCPEDLSKEALERNKKLLKEIIDEMK